VSTLSPSGSAIYFAVADYNAAQADLDGPVSNYFRGVRAGLFAAGEGQIPSEVGVYGLCCPTLVEREQVSLTWLSQSTGFLGSKAYASEQRYSLTRYRETRLKLRLDNGTVIAIDPDAINPGQPHGLFSA
jgi:hypothetical protein